MEEYPWSSKRRAHAEFTDPLLKGYEATMVCDTVGENCGERWNKYTGDRVATMVMRFPRCILPEVNTHRVFSRNSASSRARAVRTTIGGVMDDPYIPLWTMNQKGMAGGFADETVSDKATKEWLEGRDAAVLTELRLLLGDLLPADAKASDWSNYVDIYNEKVYKTDDPEPGAINIHKQNANRVIEPYMWHEALVTSTEWSNFLNLRISEFAQPEIHALAVLVKAVLDKSKPEHSWLHMPFVEDEIARSESWEDMLPPLMRSASECARISYKDRSSMANRNNNALGEKLLQQRHMSPFEHIAFSRDAEYTSPAVAAQIRRSQESVNDKWNELDMGTVFNEDGEVIRRQSAPDIRDSNLGSQWIQLRHLVEY